MMSLLILEERNPIGWVILHFCSVALSLLLVVFSDGLDYVSSWLESSNRGNHRAAHMGI